jgi:hypothetical protein
MNTLELIIKPCQSGKTFIMLQEIAKMLDNDDNNIHIIFCDNQLLQTQQTSDRVDTFNDLEEYRSNDGDVSVILSSKSKIKNHQLLSHQIIFENKKTIITCSNKTRLENIDKLITDFAMNKRFNDYNFCLWIDEVDKNISLFEDYLNNWDKNPRVLRVGLITATPENLLKKFKTIKIFQLEKSHNPDEYHSFSESEFKLLNFENIDIELYLTKIIKEFKNDFKNGQVWFVPGEVKKESHNSIKDVLLKNDFKVLVINGEGIILYTNKENELLEFDGDNLADFLGNIYVSKNLINNKLAITGNLCISRGITINNNKMLITHAILPTNISNRSNAYQLAGRICGNIKKFENYKKPVIYCTQKFKSIIFDMENRAKNIAEEAFKLNKQDVSFEDYKYAEKNITNSGIPILLKLNEEAINKIITINKITDDTRIIIQNFIKKIILINHNNDFDINTYRLKNKYIIKKTDVDKDGKSKYEYKNFLTHHKNKKQKIPNINCKNGEYLIYIIIDDIPIWNVYKGDSIIIYKTKSEKIVDLNEKKNFINEEKEPKEKKKNKNPN